MTTRYAQRGNHKVIIIIITFWLADAVHNSSDSWKTDVDMALSGMITFGLLVVLIGEILILCYNY